MKRFVKIGALLLVMALLSVVASLQTIVSSTPFKNQLVASLTASVPGEIELGSLSLDFSTGIQVENIQWHQQGVPIVQLEHMLLDIVWQDLLRGQLTIREIHFRQGRIAASQENLLTLNPPASASARPASSPLSALSTPTLPIQLDMQSLIVHGINLNFALGPTQQIAMRNLNLRASLRWNRQGVDLKGRLAIDALTFADDQNFRSVPVALDFNLQGDLARQGLRSTQSGLRLGDLIHIPLDIQIRTDQQPAEILLAVSTDQMELPPIVALVEPWLPPAWRPATLNGQLQPIFSLAGQWRTDGFHGQASGEIVLKNLHADLPNLEAKIVAPLVRFTLTNLKLHANSLQEFASELSLTASRATWAGQQVSDASLLVVADHQPDGQMAGHMRVKANQIALHLPDQTPPPFPLETMLLATGQLSTQTFNVSQFVLKAGELLKIKGRGATSQTPQGWQLQADLQTELEGTHLERLLPRHLPEEIALQIKPGKSRFTLHGHTTLGADWMPQHLEAEGTVSLMPLMARHPESAFQADLQALELAWKASQPQPGGAVEASLEAKSRLGVVSMEHLASCASGTLSVNLTGQLLPKERSWSGQVQIKTQLEQLLQEPRIAIDRLQTDLQASVTGIVTPDNRWQPRTMQETLTGQALTLSISDASTAINLPEVNFDGRATSDLQQASHQLEQGSIRVGQWLHARLTGHYRQPDDHYELAGSIDPLDLALVSQQSPLNTLPWLEEIQPKGRLDLEFKGAGVLAAWSNWDGHTLPLQANLLINARNLAGQWEGHQMSGGQGKINLTLQPENAHHLNLTAKLQASQLQLESALQPQAIKNAHLDVDISGSGLDEFTINRGQASLPGLQAMANGRVFGASRLLTRQGTPLEQLNPLFVELSSQIKLDLANPSPLLATLGLQGTGQNRLDVKVSKATHAPFVFNATSSLDDINLNQPGFALTRATGQLTGTKTLWLEQKAMPVKARIRRAFSLDRISTPASWGDADKRLRIAALKIGDIQAEEIGINLRFVENAIRGQNLEMRLLGGTIGGNLLLDGVKPGRFSGVLEGVNIDLNRLLSASEQIAGEGAVDFVSRYAIRFDRQTGKLNWGRTEINLIFTRIGREALNRLLLFLDPKESNPAIVNARSKVSYANPASLDLQLSQGTIKLVIHFREGLISNLTLNRIPLGILGRFDQIQHHLTPLEHFARLLETLGQAHLELKEHETASNE